MLRQKNAFSIHLIKPKKKYTKTYKSGKSAVLQTRDNTHSINSVLQLCVTLGLTVCVTQLSDEDIEKNDNHHRHVGQKNEDRQPANDKQERKNSYSD